MSNKADIAMNFEASAAVGAVTCSQGGVPINGGHIQYWMGQAREARIERDTAMTDGHDRIAELNAEITRLRAERDAAAQETSVLRQIVHDMTDGITANMIEAERQAVALAAARDMQERCAKVAEAADRTGKRCLELNKTMAGSEAMRRIIVEDIKGLSVIATQGETP